jgi:hypothetical protein
MATPIDMSSTPKANAKRLIPPVSGRVFASAEEEVRVLCSPAWSELASSPEPRAVMDAGSGPDASKNVGSGVPPGMPSVAAESPASADW